MGYYIRYFVETGSAPSGDELSSAFAGTRTAVHDGEIVDRGNVCGAIEVSTPSDELFEEEIAEFREFLDEVPMTPGKRRVLECLDRCKAIVAVQVLFGTGDAETTLQKVDPLWNWLFANRSGLLQADGEGFYDGQTLLVELA